MRLHCKRKSGKRMAKGEKGEVGEEVVGVERRG
jgi:hypothetical protein